MANEEFKNHPINELENMMINIIQEGFKDVWSEIDVIKNPFERCKQRKLYWEAINKLNKGK